jgi:YfiR/HmsC-like
VVGKHEEIANGRRAWRTACAAHLCAALLLITLEPISGRTIVRAQQLRNEYRTKAAYLVNFFEFVKWPNNAYVDSQGDWVIGIIGDNPFGDDLGRMTIGKTVQGRKLVNRRFMPGTDYCACHILYISSSERKHLRTILKRLRGTSILTVSDMSGFLEAGGMIQLTTVDKRVRLAINMAATSRAGLKVSSKLLAVAQQVSGVAHVAGY